jgi:hypothetical protein
MRKMPTDQSRSPGAHLRAAGLLALSLALGSGFEMAHAAGALANPLAAAGQWDMTLADSHRSCRMMLRADPAGGASVSMPAGCRRSLPILANVGTFDVPSVDHIALADPAGNAVLEFSGDAAQALLARGPEGETYRLVAVSGSFAHAQDVAQAVNAKPPGFQTVEAKPVAATAMPSRITAAMKPGDIAGRYAVLRDGSKDTGCMITLDDKARAAKGGFKAALAPACRDQGIVIFDPMGWQLISGQLVLTARKGHTTHLDLQPDSSWAKDAKEGGKALSLKKL